MEKIITRFPPSPTGYLHVGGARTALFNWLFARHTQGEFVLRIEDTDTDRSTAESVDAIFEALEWLGIDWDRGPYFQSKRLDIYHEYIQKLIKGGHAYFCTCTPDEVDQMRKDALAAGNKPRYNGKCRERGLSATDDAVVRFKAPINGETVLQDVVKGNIVFQNSELDDFIIRRSDGVPTYNFAVVVDDITLGINTIIRGDDHVMNSPKQILIYKALGTDLPVYAHVPMVLGNDRTRLSKRHGAMSVTAYRDMGYLPDAVINYLVRLGWSYGDQEYFTRSELIDKFTLDHIGKSPGIFDADKLLSLNADHIKTTVPKKLMPHLIPLIHQRGFQVEAGDYLENVIATLNNRSKNLVEMADASLFYFRDQVQWDEKAAKKFLKKGVLEPLNLLMDQLRRLDRFNEQHLEDAFKAVMASTGLKLGKIAQPVRVALTGGTVSPGIFEIIDVLGKDKTLSRLEDAIAYIEARPASP
jgi:glutamyl-tRNA synthetase